MAFLHMHHAMANKALMLVSTEARNDKEFWKPNKARLREIVLSGAADYSSRWEPTVITEKDREIVLNYLAS